jgi:cyclophilin family peptidyl-prolyl cis-trans isomerase
MQQESLDALTRTRERRKTAAIIVMSLLIVAQAAAMVGFWLGRNSDTSPDAAAEPPDSRGSEDVEAAMAGSDSGAPAESLGADAAESAAADTAGGDAADAAGGDAADAAGGDAAESAAADSDDAVESGAVEGDAGTSDAADSGAADAAGGDGAESGDGGSDAVEGDAAGAAGDGADAGTEDGGDAGASTDLVLAPFGNGVCPPPGGVESPVVEFAERPPLCIDLERDYTAVFDTSEGTVSFDLNTNEVPITVNNFVTLARWRYYDNLELFRMDDTIDIVQGGSRTNFWEGPGPGYTIPDEGEYTVDETGELSGPYLYEAGQIAMARVPGPDSAGAQFFFTAGPDAENIGGNGIYVVFGQTDEAGREFLAQLMELHVADDVLGGVPSRPIVVNSVEIIES